jgi:hypothetical protein
VSTVNTEQVIFRMCCGCDCCLLLLSTNLTKVPCPLESEHGFSSARRARHTMIQGTIGHVETVVRLPADCPLCTQNFIVKLRCSMKELRPFIQPTAETYNRNPNLPAAYRNPHSLSLTRTRSPNKSRKHSYYLFQYTMRKI